MKLKKIFFTFIVAFVFSQAGSWTSVFASVLPEQLIHASALLGTFNSGGTIQEYQTLGTGISGSTSALNLWVKRTGGSTQATASLWACTSSVYLYSSCSNVTGFINLTLQNNISGGAMETFNFSTPLVFDSTKYYVIQYSHANGSGNQVTMYGSSSDVYPNGQATSLPGVSWGQGSPASVSPVSDFYFSFGNQSVVQSGSYIIPISPTENANTASTTVTLSASYYYDTAPTSLPFYWLPTKVMTSLTRLDVSEPTQYFYSSIVSNVLTTASVTTTLTLNARYGLSWAFVDDSGNLSLITDPYQFGVVGASNLKPGIPAQPDYSAKCSSYTYGMNYLCEMIGWFIIPSEDSLTRWRSLSLQGLFPFSYLYDVGNLYNELFANGGSKEYLVAVDTGAFGTITFISASQINAVPYASTIKTILGYLLWFMTGMFLYRLIHRVHD